MHDFQTANPDEIYIDIIKEAIKYFKEDKKGMKKMNDISEEIRQEGIEEGIEKTKKFSINNLAQYLIDHSEIKLTKQEAILQAQEMLNYNYD